MASRDAYADEYAVWVSRVFAKFVSAEEMSIAVPTLVTAEQFEMVAPRLQRNRTSSPCNTKRPSLLQGILVCRHCGYLYCR